MLPSKLRLRNFKCYTDTAPPLLLDGLHVACLCGENGAGKSALLDAITWALWGKARTKSDDDLIHLGRDEMEVELEFHIGPALYRVVRKRELRGPHRVARSSLELGVHTGSGFEPITSNTTTEMQREITKLLRMDYETFVNSAFLVQGRADEFTLKTPDKRKQVLADILNLHYFDELEERSREESRARRTERVAFETLMQQATQEIATRPALEERLAKAREEHKAEETLARARLVELETLRAQRHDLDSLTRQMMELRAQEAAEAKQLADVRKLATSLFHDVNEQQRLIADAPGIESTFAMLQQARQRLRSLEEASAAFVQLEQQRSKVEQALATKRAEAETERRLAANRVLELRARAEQRAELRESLRRTTESLGQLSEVQSEIGVQRTQLERLRHSAVELESTNRHLRTEAQAAKAKMEQLASGKGTCPLCGAPLSEDRCSTVLAEYEAEGRAKSKEFRANQAVLERMKKDEQAAQSKLSTMEEHLKREQPALQSSAGGLESRLAEAQNAAMELPAQLRRMEAVEKELNTEAYGAAERKALTKLAVELTKLAYSRETHMAARREIERLGSIEPKYHRLGEAQRRLPEDVARMEQVTAQLQQRESGREGLRVRIKELATQATFLEEASQPLSQKELAYATRVFNLAKLNQGIGAASAALGHLDEVESRLKEASAASTASTAEESLFDELTRSLGRRGLQALVIESAVPEIEEEANHLLGRMTDNRMHLKLETQAELRSRDGISETLEIKIGDELGMRSYETYSGGEAFRVNLALRIALSRMLARRAGAPLPTLFIDEGFGTQDPSGRDRIVDAIKWIQDEFELILVITHIDELKEQFPARIEVQKLPTGSTYWLS